MPPSAKVSSTKTTPLFLPCIVTTEALPCCSAESAATVEVKATVFFCEGVDQGARKRGVA